MSLQPGEPPFQILEELHPRLVVIRIHVERHTFGQSVPQQSDVCPCERCGGRNSHRLMSSRQHSPAVRRTFGNPKLIPRPKPLNHRFVIHPHVRTAGEAEAGRSPPTPRRGDFQIPGFPRRIAAPPTGWQGGFPQSPPLHTEEVMIYIIVRNQQRRCVIERLSPSPARHRLRNTCQSAPSDDPWVNPPLLIKEMRRLGINDRMSHESGEVFKVGPPHPPEGGFPNPRISPPHCSTPHRGAGGP